MKKVINILAVTSITFFMISCQNEIGINQAEPLLNEVKTTEIGTPLSKEGTCSFEYEGTEGPEFWENLCTGEWADCGGEVQSPINIIKDYVIEDDNLNSIQANFKETSTYIKNNGHTIQFNYNNGSTSVLNGVTYNLLQFHFHTGSEHTVDGVRYPMEVHFVHQDSSTGLLAVIGAFFEYGDKNDFLNQFINVLPQEEGEYFINDFLFNAKNIFGDEEVLEEYYTYGGSLTTPPCSEIVSWYVLKEPISASTTQINTFKNIMHHNYRPTQPLNGRTVSTNDA